MRIAVDAMGGDRAPSATVHGALLAAAEYGIEVVLVGRPEAIQTELDRHSTKGLSITVVEAEEVVEMSEPPAVAVKRKRRSSIVVGMSLLKNREVDALVTAGNSGAAVAAGLFTLGRIEGIDRPAISIIFPIFDRKIMLLDAGANIDCKPHHLFQFGLMGSLYMQRVLGIPQPRVGLLSNGEEPSKGNAATKEAFQLLQNADLGFMGNIEGKDLLNSAVDVVVTDGFVGNVVLKVVEGLGEALTRAIYEEIDRSLIAKTGALLMMPALRNLKRQTDYAEVGGAPLLGLNGVCIVAHGRSNSKAIMNAADMARRAAEQNIVGVISAGVQSATKGEGNGFKLGCTARAGAQDIIETVW